jgi:hypothetical protein
MRSEMCPIVVMPGRARVFRKSATSPARWKGSDKVAQVTTGRPNGGDPYGNAGDGGLFRDEVGDGMAWMSRWKADNGPAVCLSGKHQRGRPDR